MDVIGRVMDLVHGRGRRVRKAYNCWMCGMGHNNPAAFLWHINACSLEAKNKPIELLGMEMPMPSDISE